MNRIVVALTILLAMASCTGVKSESTGGKVRIPYTLSAEGYPAHVHLAWNDNVGSTYDIYRAEKSGKFVLHAQVTGNEYMDFSIGKSDLSREYTYRICPSGFPVDSASAFEVKTEVPAVCDYFVIVL